MKIIYLFLSLFFLFGCSSENNAPAQSTPTYFPPIDGNNWETASYSDLGWNQNAVAPLLDYLELKHSKSFIILVDGKIAMESYFNGHSSSTNWYWASAGKTLTSTVMGIAEQEGLLNINDKVSAKLGIGWTSLTSEQENLITNKHLLTMTSGLEDSANGDCVTPECLTYTANAGTRWAYHNVFVKLQDVIANSSGESYVNYFNTKLRDKIGMNGSWLNVDENVVYFSDSRSMARFGLLMLNKGKWENEVILNQNYFNAATSTSQNINQAYGYLWWLNGKSSYHLPQTQMQFNGSLIPSGPSDMFMALGKNDQKIYVIPSKNMVVIRMGNAADDSNFALSTFDEELWQKIENLYQ